jgi:quinol monooxygenase YgiN
MVHHIGMLQFKPGTSEAQVTEVLKGLARLKESVPGIVNFSSGKNHSPEGLDQGFTHGFIATFKDKAARDTYLDHPAHVQFKNAALPFVANVVVVDFDA